MKNGRYSQCQLVVLDFFHQPCIQYNLTCNMTNKHVQTQRVHRCPHGPIAEIFCRQVETMMTTSEESPLMKARLFRDHLPQKLTCLAGKSSLLTGDTLPKTSMEPEHHVLEKEHHLNQTSIFRVQHVSFRGKLYTSNHSMVVNFPACHSLVILRDQPRRFGAFFAPTDGRCSSEIRESHPSPKLHKKQIQVLGKK